MEVIAMSDLETNKAIALRLVEVFNGRQLDRLEDVLHPKFRGRGISAVVPVNDALFSLGGAIDGRSSSI